MTDKHVEPYGYVYEDTVRTCGGRRSHRQLRFSKTRLNISEDDISEFDITETPVYTHPPQMRALGTTPTEAPPVESQAAEIARLREALSPFANSDMRFAFETGHAASLDTCVGGVCDFTVGDLLRAAAALAAEGSAE